MKYGFLLMLLFPCLVAQADWGKLFFSPAERALSRGDGRPQAEASAVVDTFRLDGEITRNGKKLRWVNGELSRVPLPSGLKVGQTLTRETGAKRDVYQPPQE
ncbi:hypothetical protein R6242_02605 [Iodobacter sp. CM08]|uniref:hypothetical protein n=1 Tax=Iodobacter sp. CM08 TaxID=3085902 RepID=UPI002981F352|nr:hypothetical protein [Iodobacter sp. CM08]MDW5415459.1 hypothetical protein [Iodobacter sp. CM08]